ncbi:hypothetical protein [Absidia glauca]|uniref:Uncharacterized protein n=1 Tax=Absidia glauca TaxID=4829 RepID=A0A168RWU9_ABSGL|nr:hypothetical protein [Absidia glauca]
MIEPALFPLYDAELDTSYLNESLRRLASICDLKSEDAVSAYLEVAKGKWASHTQHTNPLYLIYLPPPSHLIEFYQQKRPLYTANALSALTSLNLVDTEYHWLARSALARLHCLYNRQMDLAYDLYLDILEQRWEIKKGDIIKLAQCCERKSAAMMMDDCKQMMQDKRTPTPTLMTSLLVESAVAFAQTNTSVKESGGTRNVAEKISIVLYGLASIGFHDRQKSFELYPMISQEHTTAMLLFLSTLLISVEKDDYSRVDTIDRHIQSSCRLGSINPEISISDLAAFQAAIQNSEGST